MTIDQLLEKYNCLTDQVAYSNPRGFAGQQQGLIRGQVTTLPIPAGYATEADQLAQLGEGDPHRLTIITLTEATPTQRNQMLKWLTDDTHGNGLSQEGYPMALKCEWLDRIYTVSE